MADDKEKDGQLTEGPDPTGDTPNNAEDETFLPELGGKVHGDDSALLETDDRQAAEIREIFGTTFPQYLLPVEEIVEQVLEGKADDESCEALAAMLASLMSAASRMGFEKIHEALKRLKERVALQDRESGQPIPQEQREALLNDLMDLKELAGQMAARRTTALPERQKTIFAALKGKHGIGDLALRRLSAAGLTTVDQLRIGRPEEIAAVTGLDLSIVRNVLDALREDPASDAQSRSLKPGAALPGSDNVGVRLTESISTTASGKEAEAGAPGKVESLHEEVLQKLRAEVEAEAALEELKDSVRKLRSRISENRAKISLLEDKTAEKSKTLDSLSNRMADKSAILDDLRARRDALAGVFAASEESARQKEANLEALKQERRDLKMRTIDLSREIVRMADTLGEIRRSAAKGRTAE